MGGDEVGEVGRGGEEAEGRGVQVIKGRGATGPPRRRPTTLKIGGKSSKRN